MKKRALSLGGGVAAPPPVEEPEETPQERKRRLKAAIRAAEEEIAKLGLPPDVHHYADASAAGYYASASDWTSAGHSYSTLSVGSGNDASVISAISYLTGYISAVSSL